jgi:rare lipoprotein A
MRLWTAALFCVALGFGCLDGAAAMARAGGNGVAQAESRRQHHARPSRHQARPSPHHVRSPRQQARVLRRGRGGTARHHRAATAQRGRASIYASRLAGRRMADGSRFDPRSDTVASKTLPLGTRVHVTNLRNGKTVVGHVRDRGPHRGRRILDVSPGMAARLGMGRTGTEMVSVQPADVPGISAPAQAATIRKGHSRRR